jgi:hypothetical protein
MNEKKKRDGFLEYASRVHAAVLDTKCKVLLWHYAYGFNWNESRPSFYSQKNICRLTGMSPSSYQSARKRLLELGWIIEKKRGRRQSVLVTPQIGRNDQEVESRFESLKSDDISLEKAMSELSIEYLDPFWNEDKAAS